MKMYSRCERLCVLVKEEKKSRRQKTTGERDEKEEGKRTAGRARGDIGDGGALRWRSRQQTRLPI